MSLEAIPARTDDGRSVHDQLLIDGPDSGQVRGVILIVPEGNGLGGIRQGPGGPEFAHAQSPFVRMRAGLKSQALAIAWPEPSADAPHGLRWLQREDPRHFQEIGSAAKFLKRRFPEAKIVLAGYAEGGYSVARYVERGAGEIDAAIVIGGYLASLRELKFDRVRVRGLVMHSVTQTCANAPLIEARDFARKSRFGWVEFAEPGWESRLDCSAASQNALRGHDADAVRTILDWFDGKPLPARVGDAYAAPAWNESVYFAPHAGEQIEISVFTPPGNGPFPLLVFNHGDIDSDSTYVRRSTRFRDLTIADAFVRLGFAVAQPARPGVGMSTGTYRLQRLAGDPTEKARVHAAPIAAALEYLCTLPIMDAGRLVLAGQSAGGFAVTEMSGMNIAGLRGVINFSGGRTDIGSIAPAGSGINQPMVTGFAAMGSRARVPVLLVFAENDSRYNKETIKASHAAFVAAGGDAQLLLSPPIRTDGHLVHRHPDVWRAQVRVFLASLGFPVTVVRERPPKTSFAALADAAAVPFVAEGARRWYAEHYVKLRPPKAFALSSDGRFGFASGNDAMAEALDQCLARSNAQCRLYAVDNDVVWLPEQGSNLRPAD